jgi:LCP family protein required for cell wall assembly
MRFTGKRKKVLKVLRITFLAAAGFIIIAGISVYLLLHNYIHKMNLVDPKKNDSQVTQTEANGDSQENIQQSSNSSVTNGVTPELAESPAVTNEPSTAKGSGIEENVTGIFSGKISLQNEQVRQMLEDRQAGSFTQDQQAGSFSQDQQNIQVTDSQGTGKGQVQPTQPSQPDPVSPSSQQSQSNPSSQQGQTNPSNQQSSTDGQAQDSGQDPETMQTLKDNTLDIEIMDDSEVMNLLLIGSDAKSSKDKAKYESFVILTVNSNTKKIITTSLQNNTYLQIPGKDKASLSSVYSLGGAALVAETLQENFRIKIDQYIMADYLTYIDIVDTIGGVTLKVTEEEIEPVNINIRDINEQLGDDPEADLLTVEKTYQLNGKQALAYSRNWYTSDGHLIRSGKQKEIVLSIFGKLKQFNFIELNGFLNIVLPHITTNLTESEILQQFFMMPAYFDYDLMQLSIPLKGSYTRVKKGGKTVLEYESDTNRKELYRQLYNIE